MIGWCVFLSKQLFNVWVFLITHFMDPFVTSAHCTQAFLWMLGSILSLCLRFASINYTFFMLHLPHWSIYFHFYEDTGICKMKLNIVNQFWVYSWMLLGPRTSGYLMLDNNPLLGEHSAYQLQLLLHMLINAGNQTWMCSTVILKTGNMQLIITCEHLSLRHLFIFFRGRILWQGQGVRFSHVSISCMLASLSLLTLKFPHVATDFPISVTSRKEALGTAARPPNLPAELQCNIFNFCFTSS